MRKKIVVGNWKMNNSKIETVDLIESLKHISFSTDVRVMIAPSFTHLDQAVNLIQSERIEVIAQNMNAAESGAFTGEISAKMLKSIGVNKVIIGHSERRAYFDESDLILKQKVETALNHDMEIIFCFGEELDDRKSGNHFKVIQIQLETVLFNLNTYQWSNIILAYEPVWAIGTGETASPQQAQEMHSYIRNLISQKYDQELAGDISILYGGSVKPSNIKELIGQKDINGALVGGASLKANDFTQLCEAASE